MPQFSRLASFASIPLFALAGAAAFAQQDAPTAAPPKVELSAAEQAVVEWVRENAISLKTAEARNGLEDMQPIREVVGESRMVSLGESTHGTREIFQMKHRMLEFLATEMGFTLFGIEASMPDCIPINDYVLHGRGDAATAVAGQGFWTWNTEEVIELVEWMRAYNTDPANSEKPRLEFYGYDMQNPMSAANVTLGFLEKVDADAAAQFRPRLLTPALDLRQASAGPEQQAETAAALEELGAYLDEHAQAYAQKASRDEFVMARRCVVVMEQGLEMAEQMRSQQSSPQRQQLLMRMPGQAKSLDQLLSENPDAAPEEARALVKEMAPDVHGFAGRYVNESTSDEQRKQWDAAAAALEKALSAEDVEVENREAAQAQAKDVVAFLAALREIMQQRAQEQPAGPPQNIRDRSMAQNIRWIMDRGGPDAKIVLWAHNGHTNVTPGDPEQTFAFMGGYLEKWFGDDHIPIGFSFGRGSFQAVPARPEAVPAGTTGMPEWTVDWAKPGSVDRVLAAAEIPMFLVDFRPALEEDGPVAQWLKSPHPWRMAGAVFDPAAEDNYYRAQAPGVAFEAVIYIAETTRARPSKTQRPQQAMQAAARPRLGIRFEPAEEGQAGVVVAEVTPGMPAEAAGLKVGDRITWIGETELTSPQAVQAALAPHVARNVVPLKLVRDGETIEIEVKLES